MAQTLLSLTTDYMAELGVEGAVAPTTVVGTSVSGQTKEAVDFIIRADEYLNTLWHDWKYLWKREVISATVDSDVIPNPASPTKIRQVDRASMRLSNGGTNWLIPRFMEYDIFEEKFEQKLTKDSSKTPGFWTIKPDGVMVFSHKLKTGSTYSVRYAYWRRSERMTLDSSEPLMPDEYRRLIIVKAKINYAERNAAFDVMDSAASEYEDLIDKLESNQLTGQEGRRMAAADIALESEIVFP